jgi:serine/threonine protein kinase
LEKFVSAEARELLTGLLVLDPLSRLGCGADGLEALKRHRWFASVDWAAVRARSLPAPIKIDSSEWR